MNNEEQQLFDLIHQVTEWEEIPLQTRRDFLAHLLEINTLDDKAVEFIQDMLNKASTQQSQRIQELKQDLSSYQAIAEAESNPETSWKHRLYQAATERIQQLAQNFKTGYRQAESGWNAAEEADENSANLDEVAALKASVSV